MKRTLLKGTLIVTVASLFVKVLSIVYKIPYQNTTGDTGFYIYQTLYPLFSLFTHFSSYALPLVVSEWLLTRKDKSQLKEMTKRFIIFFFLVGVTLFLLRDVISGLFNDIQFEPMIITLSIACLIIPILGILRGVLYSDETKVQKVGVSLVIEQVIRVAVILIALFLYNTGSMSSVYQVANMSFYGVIFGMIGSGCYLLLYFDRSLLIKTGHQDVEYITFYQLLKRSWILLLSASLLLLMQMVDGLTITALLEVEVTRSEALQMKGIYDRGLPLIQGALFFVSPLLSAYTPHIDPIHRKTQFSRLIEWIFLLVLPETVGFIIIFRDINLLLFKDQALTLVLQWNMGIIVLYAIIQSLMTLRMKHTKTMAGLILGSVILKGILNYNLILPLGILGASISTLLSLLTLIIILLILFRKDVRFITINVVKICCSTFLMAFSIGLMGLVLDHFFIKLVVGFFSYGVFLILFNPLEIRTLFKNIVLDKML